MGSKARFPAFEPDRGSGLVSSWPSFHLGGGRTADVVTIIDAAVGGLAQWQTRLADPAAAAKKKIVFPLLLEHLSTPRMNFPHPTRRPSEQRAFTLIELLVVITIIAVLASLLLPVGQKVLENSKKVSTKSTETQIVSAVNSYQTEYGQYPVTTTGTTPKDVTLGLGDDTAHNNSVLFNVLRAINTADKDTGVLLNSRRIPYFDSKNVKNVSSPRDGFIPPNTASATGNPNLAKPVKLVDGDLVDSWGNMYIIRVDSNYTNAVLNPYSKDTAAYDDSDTTEATDPANTDVIRTGVIVWTYGNDAIPLSTGVKRQAPYSPVGDDVDSWQ